MIKALESSGHDKSPLSALREATIDFLYDTGKENLFSYLKVDNFFQGIPATFSRQDGQCVRVLMFSSGPLCKNNFLLNAL